MDPLVKTYMTACKYIVSRAKDDLLLMVVSYRQSVRSGRTNRCIHCMHTNISGSHDGPRSVTFQGAPGKI
jgi:hypothetical protein